MVDKDQEESGGALEKGCKEEPEERKTGRKTVITEDPEKDSDEEKRESTF